MAIFNVIEEETLDIVIGTLEDIGRKVSEEKFFEIANKIDEAMPGIIELMTVEAHDEWVSEAMGAKGWGTKYANAIRYKTGGKKGEVFLDKTVKDKGSNKPSIMFAKMVENGVKSWSIRDALMKSEKAKVGKNGVKYMTVPFPVATPRKAGQGKMASKFGKREMTAEMHKIVKSGGKLSGGSIKGIDVSGLARYVTRQHHTQYGIFRRVSANSTGWQYPGIGAQPVFSNVERYVKKRMAEIITEFNMAIIKEYSK